MYLFIYLYMIKEKRYGIIERVGKHRRGWSKEKMQLYLNFFVVAVVV